MCPVSNLHKFSGYLCSPKNPNRLKHILNLHANPKSTNAPQFQDVTNNSCFWEAILCACDAIMDGGGEGALWSMKPQSSRDSALVCPKSSGEALVHTAGFTQSDCSPLRPLSGFVLREVQFEGRLSTRDRIRAQAS